LGAQRTDRCKGLVVVGDFLNESAALVRPRSTIQGETLVESVANLLRKLFLRCTGQRFDDSSQDWKAVAPLLMQVPNQNLPGIALGFARHPRQ
jgi:hypothetical protein